MDERAEALFLHEYIHYLQDITTVSGYARIETIVDQIKWAVMLGKEHHKLTIPLNPKSTWAFNMTPNATCLELSMGDFKKKYQNADVRYQSPENFEIIEHSTPFKDGRNNRVKIITRFTFKDGNDVVHQYDIGEMAISESMAYIIEQHIYPGVLPAAPDFPYNVVRNVVRWKCQRAETDEILVAICDVCLMYSFPGYAFYYLIEWLTQAKYNDNGTWKIHKAIEKVVLDGSDDELWQVSASGTPNFFYTHREVAPFARALGALSNYFTRESIASNNTIVGFAPINTTQLRFRPNFAELSIADWRTWLASHNTTVYYALATPTDTEITDSELIEQLNHIYELYQGTNNLWLIPSAGAQGEIEGTYRLIYDEETDIVPKTPVVLTLTDGGVINPCGCRQNIQLIMRETEGN